MRPVYAARLAVSPQPAAPTSDVFDGVVALARQWLAEGAARYDVRVPTAPAESFRLAGPSARFAVEAEHLATAGRRAWRAAIEQPTRTAPTLRLRSDVQVRPDGDGCVVTIRLLAVPMDDASVPETVRFDPPRLVPALLEAFPVAVGNLPASTRPKRCGEAAVGALVRDLTHPGREIPMVVLSACPDGTISIDPRLTAQTLAGIARVVRLADFATAMRLTEAVGKPLSCYEGAVRVYWPGFRPGDDRYLHPLWTAAAIAGRGAAGEMPGVLLRRIGAVAGQRIDPDPAVVALARAVARDQAEALERHRQAPRGTDAEQEELLDLAWAEIAQLRLRIAELEREQDDLQQTIAAGFSWREAFERTREQGEPVEDHDVPQDRIDGLRTLADAVQLVQETLAGPHVEFADSALKSATKAPFQGDPRQAYDALVAICEVADLYHGGRLATTFADQFRERGQDYRANVSPTALGHYPNHYTFGSSKGKVVVGPHLAIGRGNRRNSLRLYWHVDDEERRFVICHVGEHLPDTTT